MEGMPDPTVRVRDRFLPGAHVVHLDVHAEGSHMALGWDLTFQSQDNSKGCSSFLNTMATTSCASTMLCSFIWRSHSSLMRFRCEFLDINHGLLSYMGWPWHIRLCPSGTGKSWYNGG